MKFIESNNVNFKNLNYVMGIKAKNPVFESKEEYANYYDYPSKEEIREEALRLFEKESEQSKWHYGERAVLSSCLNRAERALYDAYYKKQAELLAKAEELKGGYIFLTRERNVTIHDTADFNLDFFVSKDVAFDCIDEVVKYHGVPLGNYPIIAHDENDQIVDLEPEKEAE